MSAAMRIIRAASGRPVPWKNGGGITTEIAVSPDGAGYADFAWRISMAQVASDGPFSRFEGIDRTLTMLDGAGLRLAVGGADELVLSQEAGPFRFSGDEATQGVLVDGPITDFNVMTRRAVCGHRVSVWRGGPAQIRFDSSAVVIFCRSEVVSLGTSTGPIALERHDAVVAEGERLAGLTLVSGEALLVDIWSAL